MKKIYLSLFLLMLTAQFASAQGWELFFEPEVTSARAQEILATADGNYLVRGFTPIPVFGPLYRKFNDQGEPLWERVIPGGTSNSAFSNLSDGTYITMGVSFENISGGVTTRPNIVKLDQDGNTVWQLTPQFPGDDRQITFNKAIH